MNYLEDIGASELTKCPECNSNDLVMCLDCNYQILECDCPADAFAILNLYCGECNIGYEKNLDDFFDDLLDDIPDAEIADEELSPYSYGDVIWGADAYDEAAILEEYTSTKDYDDYSTGPGEVKDLSELKNLPTFDMERHMKGAIYDFEQGFGILPSETAGHKKSKPKSSGPYTSSTIPKTSKFPTTTFQKCRHYPPETAIKVAEDVTVYPSSMNNNRGANDLEPDFGLYADTGWKPAWRNEFIIWPDFNIPTFSQIAVEQINSALDRAIEGQKVEFGCIGGHGRTGTILACMKVWGSYRDGKPVTAAEAVKWVRSKYCHEAIENEKQEWWVEKYSNIMFGTPLGEMPVSQFKTSFAASDCQRISHYQMFLAGANSCLAKDNCKFWNADFKDFDKGNIPKMKVDEKKVAMWEKKIAAREQNQKLPFVPNSGWLATNNKKKNSKKNSKKKKGVKK